MRERAEVVAVTWRKLRSDTAGAIGDPAQTRWLLEEASGLSGPRLLRELDNQAPPGAAARLESLVARRVSGEPLQHVLGHWGFRSLDVVVDRRVLIPRPETEVVVSVALSAFDRILAPQPATSAPKPGAHADGDVLAVDLGTGSGVIALSLAVERDTLGVIGTDRDLGALEVAATNLARIPAGAAARVKFLAGDWYDALPVDLAGRVTLIVANPPYLAEHEWAGLDPLVRGFDPFGALVAGPSGLEAIETVVAGAAPWLTGRGALVVEIAPHQARRALAMAREAGFSRVSVEPDLAGRSRVLVAEP